MSFDCFCCFPPPPASPKNQNTKNKGGKDTNWDTSLHNRGKLTKNIKFQTIIRSATSFSQLALSKPVLWRGCRSCCWQRALVLSKDWKLFQVSYRLLCLGSTPSIASSQARASLPQVRPMFQEGSCQLADWRPAVAWNGGSVVRVTFSSSCLLVFKTVN